MRSDSYQSVSQLARSSERHSLSSLWRLRRYLRPYLLHMLTLMVAAAGSTAALMAVPLLVQRAVDGPIQEREKSAVAALAVVVLALGIAEAALIFVRRWVQSSTALSIETAIRQDLYKHLQRLPVSFHDRWRSGQLLSRVTGDLYLIRRFLSFGLVFGVVNLITYVTVVALMLRLYWPLGLVVAASAVPLILASRRLTHTYLVASRRLQEQRGELTALVEESARGLQVIKAFGRQPYMAARFGVVCTALHDTAVVKSRLLARTSALLTVVPNVTLAAVGVGGAIAVAEGRLTIGTLVGIVSLQLLLVSPIQMLGWIIANGQEAVAAADRVYEVLDTRPTIADRPGALTVNRGNGRLRLEGVWFSYPGAAQPVLRGIDLEVSPGETLAVVGQTGCGKTTLLSLIPRLHEVTAGRITLDGRDIRDIRLDSLRRLVGTVFSEPVLFSMSIRENLTFGRPDATDAEIRDAITIAQADFVDALPWGWETRIGEQGLTLSGGQRQRLALARAVLCRPNLLVLDDPLSALDVHTEARVETALTRFLRDKTTLLVTHRLSTVALADRVAMMWRGRVVAVGTHRELLATQPNYRALLVAPSDDPVEVDRAAAR